MREYKSKYLSSGMINYISYLCVNEKVKELDNLLVETKKLKK
jgi:hypothetical protein